MLCKTINKRFLPSAALINKLLGNVSIENADIESLRVIIGETIDRIFYMYASAAMAENETVVIVATDRDGFSDQFAKDARQLLNLNKLCLSEREISSFFTALHREFKEFLGTKFVDYDRETLHYNGTEIQLIVKPAVKRKERTSPRSVFYRNIKDIK